MTRRPIRTLPIVAALLGLAALLPGCSTHASVRMRSQTNGAVLSPGFSTTAYTFSDENTVDLYLTDIPADAFQTPPDPSADHPAGQILHIHMFIRPSPGKTPIEPQAANCSIRHLILADGAIGVYGGGGFLLPSSSAKSGTFSGTISEGTLRLQAATPNFNDALGPSNLRANFRIHEDRDLANLIARRFEEWIPRSGSE